MVISRWVLVVMILLVSCGEQLLKESNRSQSRDVNRTQEYTQSGVEYPVTGTPSPHPEITQEQGEQLLRSKGKASPCGSDAALSKPPDYAPPSGEETQLAPVNKDQLLSE